LFFSFSLLVASITPFILGIFHFDTMIKKNDSTYHLLQLIQLHATTQAPHDSIFFSNYTMHRRYSQRTHTHPYEYTHANPTPRSIFEDCASKSSRLTKSPQTPRCRRERHLPLKAQTPLNPEKFAPTGSRTQDLRCYWGSCDH
jgi:hypothetical protein